MKELPEASLNWAYRHQQQTPGRKPGVYFIYSPSMKLTKIGCTNKDADKRFQNISTMNPGKLEMIAYIPTAAPRRLENALHRQLKEHRKHGEWFSLTGLALAKAIGMAVGLAAHVGGHKSVAVSREMPSLDTIATPETAATTAS